MTAPPAETTAPSRHVTTRAGELILAIGGFALIAAAAAASQGWLDQHILPSFFLSRGWSVAIEQSIRLMAAGVGAALVLTAPAIARRLTRRRLWTTAQVLTAAVLAIVAAEMVLRAVNLGPVEWLVRSEEPLRRPDPLLGWTFVPGHMGHATVGGRDVWYAFDAAGDRVRRPSEPVDPDRPTTLFVGESVMLGYGLTWDESIPAQVSKQLGVQSANLAVNGFGTDQAYLRLEQALPRFRRPVAVVMLFMTTLFGRNLDRDRPHLTPRLVWQPAVRSWRLASLAQLLVPYRSAHTISDGIVMTREVLRATVATARARGAAPLIIVPRFGAATAQERRLRHLIFDGSGVPCVLVELDPAWHLPGDHHPDARGARAIAAAITAYLRRAR